MKPTKGLIPTASIDFLDLSVSSEASFEICVKKCLADSNCHAFVYDFKNRYKNSNCWLKTMTNWQDHFEKPLFLDDAFVGGFRCDIKLQSNFPQLFHLPKPTGKYPADFISIIPEIVCWHEQAHNVIDGFAKNEDDRSVS